MNENLLLEVAKSAALQAGAKLREMQGQANSLSLFTKTVASDFVTAADLASGELKLTLYTKQAKN